MRELGGLLRWGVPLCGRGILRSVTINLTTLQSNIYHLPPSLCGVATRRVPHLTPFSQCRQQGSKLQAGAFDVNVVLIIRFTTPFDGNASETILYVEYFPMDASCQLLAVAHCHFAEQQISAAGIATYMAQQHSAIPSSAIGLADLKMRNVGGLKEIKGDDIAYPLAFHCDGQQPW